jgi:hypothetical protein
LLLQVPPLLELPLSTPTPPLPPPHNPKGRGKQIGLKMISLVVESDQLKAQADFTSIQCSTAKEFKKSGIEYQRNKEDWLKIQIAGYYKFPHCVE